MRSILVLVIAFGLLSSNRALADDETLSSFYEIAKQNCHDIACIRMEMDRINNEILRLLTERTAYVKRAGDLKSRTTKIADDRQRVADQEKKIINKSIELGLPIEVSVPAFRAIMETSIKFQQGYIDQLTPVFIAQEDLSMNEYYETRTKGVLEQALEKGCSQVLCGRIKIKDGALKEVYHWFQTLKNRKKELLDAFSHEGVWLESVFLEHAKDGNYLIYYTRQNDLETVYAILGQLGLPIRLFHVECWKKCCEECIVLEPLFDLQRTN